MFCPNCGSKLNDADKFCVTCGSKLDSSNRVNTVTTSMPTQQVQIEQVVDKGPWKGFAKVGLTMGILSIIPFVNLLGFAFFGFIFSILGIPSKTRRGRAITGLVFSVVGIVMFFVVLGLIDAFEKLM